MYYEMSCSDNFFLLQQE